LENGLLMDGDGAVDVAVVELETSGAARVRQPAGLYREPP